MSWQMLSALFVGVPLAPASGAVLGACAGTLALNAPLMAQKLAKGLTLVPGKAQSIGVSASVGAIDGVRVVTTAISTTAPVAATGAGRLAAVVWHLLSLIGLNFFALCREGAASVWQLIATAAPAAAAAVAQLANSLWQLIAAAASAFASALAGAVLAALAQLGAGLSVVQKHLGSGLASGGASVGSGLAAGGASLGSGLSGLAAGLGSALGSALGSLGGLFGSLLGSLAFWIGSAVGAVGAILGAAATACTQAGAHFVLRVLPAIPAVVFIPLFTTVASTASQSSSLAAGVLESGRAAGTAAAAAVAASSSALGSAAASVIGAVASTLSVSIASIARLALLIGGVSGGIWAAVYALAGPVSWTLDGLVKAVLDASGWVVEQGGQLPGRLGRLAASLASNVASGSSLLKAANEWVRKEEARAAEFRRRSLERSDYYQYLEAQRRMTPPPQAPPLSEAPLQLPSPSPSPTSPSPSPSPPPSPPFVMPLNPGVTFGKGTSKRGASSVSRAARELALREAREALEAKEREYLLQRAASEATGELRDSGSQGTAGAPQSLQERAKSPARTSYWRNFYGSAEEQQQDGRKQRQTSASPQPLPAGWTAFRDAQSGRMYYHERSSGATQWERPG